MLPNEIINKILEYKYHYQDFKKFLLKIKKVNREYKEKFAFIESENILMSKIPDIIDYYFVYNYRLPIGNPDAIFDIYNPRPKCHPVAKLDKNYR